MKKGKEKTTISVRVDKETKEKFREIVENMGLDISTAIKIFMKEVIKEKKIPFEVKVK